ncbi:MAG: precorrin-6A synthase (deacetylating) [Patulibacter sp.]
MSRELLLIGIGAGDPRWLTLEAVDAIGRLDVVFVVLKEREKDQLVQARRAVIDAHRDPAAPLRTVELRDPPRPWRTAPDYEAAVARWRQQRREQWSQAVAGELADGQIGGFLVWGDPGLYESTLAIVDELVAESARPAPTGAVNGVNAVNAPTPLSRRVIPGISSVHALTARHGIPLNRQGRAVQITPARLLADGGLPDGVDDAVVMLDGQQRFASIEPAGLDIYWGAYLGTPDELLIAGPLSEVRDEIVRVRAEAAARKGWMFDTYLLRRR